MRKVLNSLTTVLHDLLNGVGHLADTIAEMPPDVVKKEVNVAVSAAITLGVLHTANVPVAADAVATVVFGAAALAVAIERMLAAFRTTKETPKK